MEEGYQSELMGEELVKLMQSAEEEEGEDFAQTQLSLDNLAEGFRIVKTVTYYFYNISLSMIRALQFKEQVENSTISYHQIFKDRKQLYLSEK